MEIHERLKWARERRGFDTAADAARFLKIKYATYAGHENGLRGITDKAKRRYAAAFRVNLLWLAYGRGDPEEGVAGDQVPVIGMISKLDEIIPIDPTADIPAYVQMPAAGSNTTVAVVAANELTPGRFEGGDIVYFSDTRDIPGPTTIGLSCVVWMSDGRILVRKLQRGRKEGAFDLFSTTNDPLLDQRVSFASAIEWIKPREKSSRG